MQAYFNFTKHDYSNTKSQTENRKIHVQLNKAQLSQYKALIKDYVMSKSNNIFLPTSTIAWDFRNYSHS